jgi:hypothetical protein
VAGTRLARCDSSDRDCCRSEEFPSPDGIWPHRRVRRRHRRGPPRRRQRWLARLRVSARPRHGPWSSDKDGSIASATPVSRYGRSSRSPSPARSPMGQEGLRFRRCRADCRQCTESDGRACTEAAARPNHLLPVAPDHQHCEMRCHFIPSSFSFPRLVSARPKAKRTPLRTETRPSGIG